MSATTPDLTFNSAAEAFYAVLHAAADDSKADAARLLPIAEMQVERHRQIVAELRGLQERAEAELDRWAVATANLRSAVDPDAQPGGSEFGGRALATVAADVFAESGKPSPIHYHDLQYLIRLAGYQVSGRDPSATLLVALGRSKQWESIGGRTGLWKIAEADG